MATECRNAWIHPSAARKETPSKISVCHASSAWIVSMVTSIPMTSLSEGPTSADAPGAIAPSVESRCVQSSA
jgi:hypothetical protein